MYNVIIFLVVMTGYVQAMQTVETSALTEESLTFHLNLKKHAHTIASIRSSLWQAQHILVIYQYCKSKQPMETHALDCHHDNIKRMLQEVFKECENACRALSFGDLPLLTQHTQNAQRSYAQLNHEANHFRLMVAKRFAASKM